MDKCVFFRAVSQSLDSLATSNKLWHHYYEMKNKNPRGPSSADFYCSTVLHLFPMLRVFSTGLHFFSTALKHILDIMAFRLVKDLVVCDPPVARQTCELTRQQSLVVCS